VEIIFPEIVGNVLIVRK